MSVLVVEWIQYFPPKEVAPVRFRPRTLLRAFDGGGEARLLAVRRVALDDTALRRFINRFVGGREKHLRTGDILGGERLRERLGRVVECDLAAQIEDMLPRGGAYRFLCGTGDSHKNRL